MSIALYREFRPTSFDDVVGQKHITKTLINQVKNNNITHAYLFTGPRGTGKTSCAKILSKAINCLNPQNGSPCGKCENCIALNEVNTDILEIDAASNNRVDEIRELRERVKYPPIVGKKKVYIIDEVHMLTESAFNALLKTLEEPPSYVVFILATTEVHKLPATILSRCTRFDFRLLSNEELVEQLKKIFDSRQISYDEESLYVIAKQGEGSVRDTLSIADSVLAYAEGNININKTLEVLGFSSLDTIANIIEAIGNKDINGVFTTISHALSCGKNISLLCKEMTEFFKNLLLVSLGITDYKILSIMPTDLDRYKELSGLFTVDQLKLGFEKFSRIELDLKFSMNPRNLLESVAVSLVQVNSTVIEKPVLKQPNEAVKQVKIEQAPILEKVSQLQEVKTSTLDVEEKKDVGRIWGEVLRRIKEKNMFALSASLKNIYGVEGQGKALILRTNDKSVYQTVDSEEKKSVILSVLKEISQDFDIIQIVYDEDNKSQQDIIKHLKDTFMDKIRIKD